MIDNIFESLFRDGILVGVDFRVPARFNCQTAFHLVTMLLLLGITVVIGLKSSH